MNLSNKILPVVLLLSAGGAMFYAYGRSMWHPILVKASGGRTIPEVVETIKTKSAIDFDATQWNRLVLLGLKKERMLEVWGIDQAGQSKQITVFPFTGFSGTLGPKLKEGDGQIPEGIYRIEYLNPNSSYHLSMKLDYPNAYDRKKGVDDGRVNLGFDIFIHGKSSTVGCIPIGDAGIEELFLMVSEMGKENVAVIVSPYDMREGQQNLQIPNIDWEQELYSLIAEAIKTELSNN